MRVYQRHIPYLSFFLILRSAFISFSWQSKIKNCLFTKKRDKKDKKRSKNSKLKIIDDISRIPHKQQ